MPGGRAASWDHSRSGEIRALLAARARPYAAQLARGARPDTLLEVSQHESFQQIQRTTDRAARAFLFSAATGYWAHLDFSRCSTFVRLYFTSGGQSSFRWFDFAD